MSVEPIFLDAIRTTAEAYQDNLTAKVRLQEEADQLARKQKRQEEVDKRWAMLTKAQQVLAALQASKALEAIRDGVWEEGYVESGIGAQAQDTFIDQGSALHGVLDEVKLISDPYPVLISHNYGKYSEAEIVDERTTFRVSVMAPNSSGKSIVQVTEQGLHDVNDLNNYRRILAAEAIRKHGLRGGLRIFSKDNYWIVGNLRFGEIDPSSENAGDKFFHLLWQGVESSRQKHNLPWEIGAWANGMVEQLPKELQETGKISPKALCRWGNRIRGGSRLGAAWFNFQDWVSFQCKPDY